MRDPKRIPKTLSRLRTVWESSPDLRLAQLISVITSADSENCPVYYMEDEQLLLVLEALMKDHPPVPEPPEVETVEQELERYKRWVSDLLSNKYVNCVYCGHRYGPDPGTPASMADVLKKHIEMCPKHPLSQLKKELKRVQAELATLKRKKS